MSITVNAAAIKEASEKLSNWGKWGKDDQIGTLNYVTPQDIVEAASWSSRAEPSRSAFRSTAPARRPGLFGGRFNPIHQMLATGTDALAGQQDWNKLRYADDTLMLCVQGATHWDALGHIFYEDKAYNGHNPKLIDSRGLSVLGIEHSEEQDERPRRSARHRALPRRAVAAGRRGIGNDELDACAKGARREDRPRGFRHRPHRPDGALPRREQLGRLRGRRLRRA
jgi:hypothetical protein